MENYEIERKFMIEYPDIEYLTNNASCTEIVQTYLKSEKGTTARVRKRGCAGKYTYTHTEKIRINDIKRIEKEREITREEYELLLLQADCERNTIYKKRFCLEYKNQLFEIDVFPFWADKAIMEIELDSEEQAIAFPPSIKIIRELSSDKRYTNAALARKIPD